MKTISVQELSEKIKSGGAVVVDVRTPSEYRGVHYAGSRNIPTEQIMAHANELKQHDAVYISCNSGGRSKMVVEDFGLHGLTNLVNVEGGIQAWIKAGLPVLKARKWTMPVMQQVMAIAGSMVLVGALGSLYLDPRFIWLSVGVGAGLTYAGLSGNCYMSCALEKMPWNK
ncbi:MAG: rhodanese-like domain-containing protein [bacterium]|nr:rhodanese-like domain-containing protein [bacterium]